MDITLRKVRVNHRLSEETLNFSADILIDGKRVGEATNHGTGGPTDYRIPPALVPAAQAAARAWIEQHGRDGDRALLAPKPDSTYQIDPLEFLIDLLVEADEKRKQDEKTAKIEAKNAAGFAAQGKPWMVRIRTASTIVWYGLPDAHPTTVSRVLAIAAKKYGEPAEHHVLPTAAPASQAVADVVSR